MPGPELSLVDDCAHCLGLCCVLLGFERSADFAADKPADTPCPQLDPRHRCRIHESLEEVGYRGCVAFSCFGAGPTLTQAASGRTWVGDPHIRAILREAFPRARRLHELALYLRQAGAQRLPPALEDRVRRTSAAVEESARNALDASSDRDLETIWASAVQLLNEVSEQLRGPRLGRDLRGADLIGARLRGADLRRANLRGVRMIGADLRRADLRLADLTGADLRDARLDGADLSTALFVTASQLVPTRGSSSTRLPAGVTAPASWRRPPTR